MRFSGVIDGYKSEFYEDQLVIFKAGHLSCGWMGSNEYGKFHELEMKEGEALEVTVDAESGNLSLLIQKDDDKPIYQGNKIKSAKFQVGIETEGTYTLTVTGRKARGYVMIKRVEGGINGA